MLLQSKKMLTSYLIHIVKYEIVNYTIISIAQNLQSVIITTIIYQKVQYIGKRWKLEVRLIL